MPTKKEIRIWKNLKRRIHDFSTNHGAIVCVACVNGRLQYSGSATLVDDLLSKELELKLEQIHLSRQTTDIHKSNNIAKSTQQILDNDPTTCNIRVDYMRRALASAIVGNTKKRGFWDEGNKPVYWPEDVAFHSVNFSKEGQQKHNKKDLIKIWFALRKYLSKQLTPPTQTKNTTNPLAAKDINAPVAMVRPVSKLPQPGSKLTPPRKRQKRSRLEAPPAPAPKPTARSTSVAKPKTTGIFRGRSTSTSRTTNAKITGPAVKRSAAASARTVLSRTGRRTAVTKPASSGGKKKAKRPAWDVKGRLEDMEKEMKNRTSRNSALEDKINGNNDRIEHLDNLNSKLKRTVAEKEEQTSEATESIRQLKRKLQESGDELATSTRRLQQKLDDVDHKHTTLERKYQTLEGDMTVSTQQCAGLKSTVAQMTSAQACMQSLLSATQLNLQQALEAGKLKDDEIFRLKQTVADHEASIAEKECKIREDESVRRKLHNTIQELKGNIRVFCRVRPLLGDECAQGEDIQHLNFPDDDGKLLEMDKCADVSLNESTLNSTRRGGTNKYKFQFDKVFSPTSKQQDIFNEISQLVQSSLDGFNVCIFAYGQTGSGKTYTMEGPDDPDDETMGMIPRAVEQVFDTAQDLKDKGWEYEMEASFVEIYNEIINDLLGSSKNKDLKHDIKMVDAKKTNKVEVTNLNRPIVKTQTQVAILLKKASHNRAVAATNCNERSSRSHSVFCLKLQGDNKLTGEHCQGTLNLVDLAGSERLSQSGSKGDRLRETKCINKSLSNLGNVIMALNNKDSHIPYRNSKLTHMLQNCLGGNSKTLMFVNVSPKEDNFQESLCSLRFATKVNQTNIGTAQKKVK